jgi:hypothetical protein
LFITFEMWSGNESFSGPSGILRTSAIAGIRTKKEKLGNLIDLPLTS